MYQLTVYNGPIHRDDIKEELFLVDLTHIELAYLERSLKGFRSLTPEYRDFLIEQIKDMTPGFDPEKYKGYLT